MLKSVEIMSEGKKEGILNPSFDKIGIPHSSPDSKKESTFTGGTTTKRRSVNLEDGSDPFAVSLDENSELENEKSNPCVSFLKCVFVALLLYVFICSLDFMASAFRLISGKTTGTVLQNSYIQNPIVGLMVGILVTVLVQSSSTSTSIIVSMVNAQILYVRDAVPMIMGSNIGTSVTNTIVSLTQIGDRGQFRRAFAGATVHDMFNWLTVITLISVEIPFHMLERLTGLIAERAFSVEGRQAGVGEIKILKHITEPFTKVIIKMDYPNDEAVIQKNCDFLFAKIGLDDTKTGIILLLISLFLLCVTLVLIVKILNSMLKGTIAMVIKRVINADIPYAPWLTGYLAILIGAVMTFIVQSSSIFTSTLTPLIGLGLISVDRSYPLTLGSNIGTTTTALFASTAGEGVGLQSSVQIALVHLFFNIFGILIYYPIPFMRWPILIAKRLGNITADHRWFAVFYLVVMFFFLPAFVFGLSLAGSVVLQCVGLPVLIMMVSIIIINILQRNFPRILPSFLKNWDFLPLPLRSLDPYDRIFLSAPFCKRCKVEKEAPSERGVENPTFEKRDSFTKM